MRNKIVREHSSCAGDENMMMRKAIGMRSGKACVLKTIESQTAAVLCSPVILVRVVGNLLHLRLHPRRIHVLIGSIRNPPPPRVSQFELANPPLQVLNIAVILLSLLFERLHLLDQPLESPQDHVKFGIDPTRKSVMPASEPTLLARKRQPPSSSPHV